MMFVSPSPKPLRRGISRARRALIRSAIVVGLSGGSSVQHSHAQDTIVPTADQVAAGDLATRFKVDEANPEGSVPSPEQALKSPLEMGYLMMDLIARAEAATQRGDHAAAIRYYKAVAKAVPDRAVSFAKLCRAHKELGQLDMAIEACRTALGKGGAHSEDHALFVRLLLRQPGELSAAHVADADAVIEHVHKEVAPNAGGVRLSTQLACELGARVEDEQRLAKCVSELSEVAPSDARTLTFRFALAMLRQDLGEADRVVAAARTAGLPQAALSSMVEKLASARTDSSLWRRTLSSWELLSAAAALLALGLVLVLARRRSSLSAA
jgi:tetratricopeptide (TPR) repeat protein